MIYHYCSVDTFFKIIESRKLWLSNSNSMNDKFESIWIDKIIRDSKDDIKNQYFSRFISIYDSLEAKDHYFVSFSKDKDKLRAQFEQGTV